MEEQYKKSIELLEYLKIKSPVLPNNNFNYRFAYMDLLQDMYAGDILVSNAFSDPTYNYSNYICNHIIYRIIDTRQEFKFDNINSHYLVYLNTLPHDSINYINKLHSICFDTYEFNSQDIWNIKYYYTIFKFIPIYFELILGLNKTPNQIRCNYIQKFNNIFNSHNIYIQNENYMSCNFWIKDMFRRNDNDNITLLLELIDTIYKDKSFILQKDIVKMNKPKRVVKKKSIIDDNQDDILVKKNTRKTIKKKIINETD